MDIFSHLFAVKLQCVFEKMKINEIEVGIGPLLIKCTDFFVVVKTFEAIVCCTRFVDVVNNY